MKEIHRLWTSLWLHLQMVQILILFFQSWLMAVSAEARNRVPVLIPCAPRSNAAANPRPSAIPPAASTGMRFPTWSTTCGTSESALTLAQKPLASLPWAIIASTPSSTASRACLTVWTCCRKRIPTSWARLTSSPGLPSAYEIILGLTFSRANLKLSSLNVLLV